MRWLRWFNMDLPSVMSVQFPQVQFGWKLTCLSITLNINAMSCICILHSRNSIRTNPWLHHRASRGQDAPWQQLVLNSHRTINCSKSQMTQHALVCLRKYLSHVSWAKIFMFEIAGSTESKTAYAAAQDIKPHIKHMFRKFDESGVLNVHLCMNYMVV